MRGDVRRNQGNGLKSLATSRKKQGARKLAGFRLFVIYYSAEIYERRMFSNIESDHMIGHEVKYLR